MSVYTTIFHATVSSLHELLTENNCLVATFDKKSGRLAVDLDAVRKLIDKNAAAELSLDGFVVMLLARPVRNKSSKLTAFKAQSESLRSTEAMLALFRHYLHHDSAKRPYYVSLFDAGRVVSLKAIFGEVE